MVHEFAGRSVRPRAGHRRPDAGFTLIEVMFSMVLFGILVGIAVGPYATYRAKQEHKGATRELVAFLRRAQVRAVAEETTYRVDLSADGRVATTYRFNGATYDAGHVYRTPSSRITFSNPAFTSSEGSGAVIYFFARGSASKGSLTVVRQGAEKVYTIQVEGLTARVSYN